MVAPVKSLLTMREFLTGNLIICKYVGRDVVRVVGKSKFDCIKVFITFHRKYARYLAPTVSISVLKRLKEPTNYE